MAEPDRRIRRTRRTLGQALIGLILEKGYDRVTVQDILDRADVGRSTFYAHFRDKEALLVANFDDLGEQLHADLDALTPGVAPPDPTHPVGVIYRHAYERRAAYRALCGKQGGNIVYAHLHRLVGDLLREHLRPHLAAAGSDRVCKAPGPSVGARQSLDVDVVAEFYTSAALGLLIWWVDQDFPYDPATLATMYHRLAVPGVLAALEGDHHETGHHL
jgi:AcrR family transcriptional regulator